MFGNQFINSICGFMIAGVPLMLYPVFVDTSNKKYLFTLILSVSVGLVIFIFHSLWHLRRVYLDLAKQNEDLKKNNAGLIERTTRIKKERDTSHETAKYLLNENTRLNNILKILLQGKTEKEMKEIKTAIELNDLIGGNISNGTRKIQNRENN